jgi:TIR domain
MIVILHDGTESADQTALRCERDVRAAFKDAVEVTTMSARSPSRWPSETSWDDLLIVMYTTTSFPEAGDQFAAEYLAKNKTRPLILPVALDPTHQRPPRSAERFKAFEVRSDSFGTGGRLINRVGAILGLRVQRRDAKIFISYRARDGSEIATQLHQFLTSLGFNVFLDEARELDGDTMILPGSDVQKEIDNALADANFLLLLDTAAAPESSWIQHEIDTANAMMLPILPICFRDVADSKIGPRFRSLLELQRWVSLETPSPSAQPPLNSNQLGEINMQMETYVCEVFQRRCRVPFIVEKEFVSRRFAWRMLDRRLLMFESLKEHSARLTTKVISHCSVFDQVYSPAIKAFAEFLDKTGRCNYSLFIYDGALIPEPQLKEIVKKAGGPAIILHHQELATLIDSNFTKLK